MPTYFVQHLATFAIGPKYDVMDITHGMQKFRDLQQRNAVWPEPMTIRLQPEVLAVESQDREVLETFPTDLISDALAYVNRNEQFDNLLAIVVPEQVELPEELHIFQCVNESARDVADDIKAYVQRYKRKLQQPVGSTTPISNKKFEAQNQMSVGRNAEFENDFSAVRDRSASAQQDLIALNRCLDDIEYFVGRLQQIGHVHREREEQLEQLKTLSKRKKKLPQLPPLDPRFEFPPEHEFVDILQKFKHAFNLLTALQQHIRDPDAHSLIHMLMGSPLHIVVNACRQGLRKDIPSAVESPLLNAETISLFYSILKENDRQFWLSLGNSWTKSEDEWFGWKPPSYTPHFSNWGPSPDAPPVQGFARRPGAVSAGAEKKSMMFQQQQQQQQQNRFMEDRRDVEDSRRRMENDRRRYEDFGRADAASSGGYRQSSSSYKAQKSASVSNLLDDGGFDSGRANQFLATLKSRNAQIARVNYDRSGVNPKELSVTKGEYLEVLNDSRNWWECRNVMNRIGFVPNTILTVVSQGTHGPSLTDPLFVNPSMDSASGGTSFRNSGRSAEHHSNYSHRSMQNGGRRYSEAYAGGVYSPYKH